MKRIANSMVRRTSKRLRGMAVGFILLQLVAGCQPDAAPAPPAAAAAKQPEQPPQTSPAPALIQAAVKQEEPSAVAEPVPIAGQGYIRSTGCQECHAEQYNSWHATYHRTMTQEASPESIQGKFDGELLTVAGYPAQPFRIGDKFYVTVVHPAWDDQELKAGRDPTATPQPPPITYAVDRVIGSHHQQVYLSKAPDGSYHTLPIVWDIHQNRWLTRKASFLLTPEQGLYHMTKLWNNGCVFCHNTGPDPGLQQQYLPGGGTQYTWNTQVEELGIACEACHGPGARHAELHRGGLAKSQEAAESVPAAGEGAASEQFIVNPLKLSKAESVLTCSRCHGKMIAKAEFDRQCLVDGDFFEPGKWEFAERYDHPTHDPAEPFDDSEQGRYFWSDGTPRTTALEYQGVLLSACYDRGEMTCLSCHSMHAADPNDQLIHGDAPDLEIASQNRACTQCHTELASPALLAQHSHHGEDSSGSLCYNCHMPFQAYSLLKRVRSHRITNPTATSTAEAGLPNACNQCHVDQTLAWTHQQLASWKEQPASELTDPHAETSSTVAHALAGHALQRALAIEQLGDTGNFEIAGSEWRAPVLVEMLSDSYEANRLLAYRALKKLAGFEDLEFDYIATPDVRAKQVAEAEQRLEKQDTAPSREKLLKILGGSPGDDPQQLMQLLIERRNHVNMQVLE